MVIQSPGPLPSPLEPGLHSIVQKMRKKNKGLWEGFLSWTGSGAYHFCPHAIGRAQSHGRPDGKGCWKVQPSCVSRRKKRESGLGMTEFIRR